MFVLDTNVLSAMMRAHPPPEVMAWVDGQDEELLFTTSITEAEILSGLAIMTQGRRRRDLEAAAVEIFANEFEGRVLPFDTTATAAYADLFGASPYRQIDSIHGFDDRFNRSLSWGDCRDA